VVRSTGTFKWIHAQQIKATQRVASNTADDDEMDLFEYGLQKDARFKKLVQQLQKDYESQARADKATQIRVALKRVVVEKRHLLPKVHPWYEEREDILPVMVQSIESKSACRSNDLFP